MKENLLRPIRMNRRKIFVFLLLLVLLLPTFAYAESFLERALAAPFNGIVNGLRAIGFKTIDELVFSIPDMETAPFTKDEWDIAMKWYGVLEAATSGIAVIAMIINGFRLMSAGSNPAKRADAMQKMRLIVLAYAIIWFLPQYSKLIFMANAYLTEVFKNLLETYAGGKFAQGGWTFIDAIQTNSVLTTALVKLAFVGLMIYFNLLYTIRKFVLISMLVVVPIVVWSWTITGFNRGIGLVAGEIMSNAFMQSSHALVLSLYAVLVSPGFSTDFSVWWAQLFGMIALIPTSKVLRELFMGFLKFLGVNEEFYAGLAMAGFSGLAAIAGTAKHGWSRAKIGTAHRATNSGYEKGGGSAGAGGNGGGGNTGGTGPYGGQEVEGEPLFSKERAGFEPASLEAIPTEAQFYPKTFTSTNAYRPGQRTYHPPSGDVPGGKYSSSLNTAEKAGNILGGTLGTIGAVAGGAMGLALGGSAVKDFGEIGAGIGGAVGAAGGNLIGTAGGIGANIINYKYATDDPTKVYADEKGNGLIKGVEGENGEMVYFMPHHAGYENITPTKTFKTEIEAQEAGYKPIQTAGIDERIRNITGTHEVDGTGKIIGTTLLSPLGPRAAEIGGKGGELLFRGGRVMTQKGYEWIKNLSKNPDKFRWKQ